MKSKTIVFIHGMYMTPLCWEQWANRFQAKGYNCLAPAWPGRDKPVDTLRKNHPDPQLGKLTLTNVVEHLANTIEKLDEKPILIGHSMGGLVVQLLLQRDMAAAGVAISSAPPMGVFTTKLAFLKSNWPHITPFTAQSVPIQMTFERFQYTFVNTLPLAEQQAAFEKYVVPESRGVPRESLTAKVDFKKQRPPLLLVAGSTDNLIPASLNKTNYDKYKPSSSITDFKEFAGRTHFIVGQKGWEEVADYILSWLNDKGV
ncbi:alpha/beta hydrolase [Acinetobacter junii]|uniref:alpha/beta hydrolase n=1 Tax=Acinetobacter junii TaxID=40215 RepID=UPI00124FF9CC|nr:alpha/beta hydrolase [Acinetobacter junii]